uniref:Uncharacterized protein n=1 Tax=Kalanchoe fedtschenkoi TaxID=63787 RepID=A0A7N0UTX0_KALFE
MESSLHISKNQIKAYRVDQLHPALIGCLWTGLLVPFTLPLQRPLLTSSSSETLIPPPTTSPKSTPSIRRQQPPHLDTLHHPLHNTRTASSHSSDRVFNFSARPAKLPESIMRKIESQFLGFLLGMVFG